MKKIIYILLAAAMVSCSVDNTLTADSVIPKDNEQNDSQQEVLNPPNPLDTYIQERFTKPYNIRILYRFVEKETTRSWVLTPTKYDKAVQFASVFNYLFIEPYVEVTSKKFMKEVRLLQVDIEQKPTHLADQIYFEVLESDKFDALTRIVDIEPEFYGLVFCRTRTDVDELTLQLVEHGYAAEGLHGEISQAQREKTLNKFRKHLVNILVATDVAARGIDIADLTHVINYSLPQDPEAYVHRVGRTGRAGKQGTAITFVSPSEYRKLLYFQKSIKFKIRKETLPNAQDVVEVKRELLKDELREVVENEQYQDYMDIASELLQEFQPEVALAALFRMAYKSDLDVTSYQEIRGFNVERRGTTRLFIALGKRDGYNARRLTEYICDQGRVRSRDLEDVLVLEDFSFVTVSYEKAKQLLTAFSQEQTADGKPMISKAKERGAKKQDEEGVKKRGKRKK